MNLKKFCYTINSYNQAVEVISICKMKKKLPVLFINYYLIKGFGTTWLNEIINMLNKKFSSKDFKIYVETKKNYGLFINLIEQKINYIKVQGDKEILNRLKQIAKINKVSINPDFDIVDLSRSKKL